MQPNKNTDELNLAQIKCITKHDYLFLFDHVNTHSPFFFFLTTNTNVHQSMAEKKSLIMTISCLFEKTFAEQLFQAIVQYKIITEL